MTNQHPPGDALSGVKGTGTRGTAGTGNGGQIILTPDQGATVRQVLLELNSLSAVLDCADTHAGARNDGADQVAVKHVRDRLFALVERLDELADWTPEGAA